jgi:hypothetical protein
MICGGQIAFQAATIFFLRKDRILHYIGNTMTISLAGSILLLPAILLSNFEVISSPYVYVGWFLMVVGVMFLEHIRRVKLLEISWVATLSWVIYRVIVLIVIF